MVRAVVVLVVALVAATAASAASSAKWVPGNPYFISEEDAQDLLERTYDFAYCQGITRFGRRGEFPYEEFIVFDCTLDGGSYNCYDVRFKAVKTTPRLYYRLKRLANGTCY